MSLSNRDSVRQNDRAEFSIASDLSAINGIKYDHNQLCSKTTDIYLSRRLNLFASTPDLNRKSFRPRYSNLKSTLTLYLFWLAIMGLASIVEAISALQTPQRTIYNDQNIIIDEDDSSYSTSINYSATQTTVLQSDSAMSISRQVNDVIHVYTTVNNAEDQRNRIINFANEVDNNYDSYVNLGHTTMNQNEEEGQDDQNYSTALRRPRRQPQHVDESIVEFARRLPKRRKSKGLLYEVSHKKPIHILFPLPKEVGRPEVNPFGITLDLAAPIVDIAIDEVYRQQLAPNNSMRIHMEDSRLSDAHGPNVAIDALVRNELDCIIGYAFVYALAPVARMSPYWRDNDSNGIPVITSIGLTSNLDNRREYQLMTRISSPYKVVKNAVLALFEDMGWRKCAYIFHDQRYDNQAMSVPYGECYLLMASIQPYLHRINKLEHNYFMFNEARYNKERMYETLKKASSVTNGRGCTEIF